jgi:LmeA-like phospholipid-binding
VFFLNSQGLGEQALNKIAQIALQSQFNQAQHLAVRVKTDPSLLAQGRLESLSIDGVGLVMQSNLRMQEMRIQMGSIAVSPFKALMGNIQLTEPSQGTAHFVLTDADLNRALNEKSLHHSSERLNLQLDGQAVTLVPGSMRCHLLASGKIAIAARVRGLQTQANYPILLSARPELHPETSRVFLAEVQYKQGQELSPQLTKIWLETVTKIINLRNFEMPGLSLQIHQLKVEEGKLTLQATAKMTHFPSSR